MSSDPLAPYHGIAPDTALRALGSPLDTAGFASIAEACRRGRDDLAGRGLDDQGQKTLRRFSTWEITKYLIPVAPAHFRRVLRQNPDLPQGLTETEGGAKWFTLDEVLRLRAFFASEGAANRDYLPYRPAALMARWAAVEVLPTPPLKLATASILAGSPAGR